MAHTTAAPQSVGSILKKLEELGGDGFTFGPLYRSDLDNADRERLTLAKRLHHAGEIAQQVYFEKLTLWRRGETHCAYCLNELVELRHTRVVMDKLLHLSCAEKFDSEWCAWGGRVEVTAAGRAALNDANDAWEQDEESRQLAAGDR
jgi:hypothetical protein